MGFQLTPRERRWFDAILVLGALALGFIVVGFITQIFVVFGDDYEDLWDGERTARTGCVDMKRLLADRIVRHYAPARERYLELQANPTRVDEILAAGAAALAPRAAETMAEVRQKMGLR